MTKYVQVLITAGSKDEADRIATAILEDRLAGCVQVIGPITSRYWWEGKIEVAEEWLCLIKSHTDLYPQLEAKIRASHSYQVPEVLCMPVEAGNQAYLDWLSGELRRADGAVGKP